MSTDKPSQPEFKSTGLGRVLAYIKDYWSMIVAVVVVAAWMQTQYMLDVDTRDRVADIPLQMLALTECHRHMDNGNIMLLPCAMPGHLKQHADNLLPLALPPADYKLVGDSFAEADTPLPLHRHN